MTNTSPAYCRECGAIAFIKISPTTADCAACGAERLYRLRLPMVVSERLERELASVKNVKAD